MIYIVLFFSCLTVLAFPEFSRHGYANCITCHVSPAGAGLLNPYGRELSKEALSTWGKKVEQKFAYGVVDLPKNVNAGAFFRVLQIHTETPAIKQARTIVMQADAEGSLTYKRASVVASVGRQEQIVKGEKEILPISRRHYVMLQPIDSILIRTGKFNRYFGLNTPYHTSYVQRDLRFGNDTETYNAEVSYQGQNVALFWTSILGTLQDKTSFATEKGQTVSAQYYLNRQKIGMSYFNGEDDTQKREVLGPWFILSYNKHLYWMSEVFFQHKSPQNTGDRTKGYAATNRFNYEIYKGFIPFLTFESSQIDWTNDATKKQAYGAGIQWFPRPHWEFMGTYQRDRLYAGDGYFADTFWLMVNFYL